MADDDDGFCLQENVAIMDACRSVGMDLTTPSFDATHSLHEILLACEVSSNHAD